MSLDKAKANVFARGKHTLFMFTATKPNGSKRDVDIAREQLANILKVPLVKVVPNHDYEGRPKEAAFVFRFKGLLPDRVRNPDGKGRFIDKGVVFHFPEEVVAPKKTSAVLEAMPGTENDEDTPDVKAGTSTPTDIADIVALLVQRQDEQMKQTQMLAEIIGRLVLKI